MGSEAYASRRWINFKLTHYRVVDYADEQGRRARRQFETKRQADAFRVEAEGQIRAGTYRADGDRKTVQEAADQFLAYCRGRMERRERMTRGNFEVYTGHVRNYICPALGRSARTLQNVCAFDAGLAAVKLRLLAAARALAAAERLHEHDSRVKARSPASSRDFDRTAETLTRRHRRRVLRPRRHLRRFSPVRPGHIPGG